MTNNRYNYFKTFKKIQNHLNEAAVRWKDLNGCYPSVAEFSKFINEQLKVDILPLTNNEELDENYVNLMARFLIEGPDHDLLGIPEGATPEEIKAAFRKKARETHPDTGGDAKKFEEVKSAYDRLSGKSKPSSRGKSTRTPPPSGGTSTPPPGGAAKSGASSSKTSSTGSYKKDPASEYAEKLKKDYEERMRNRAARREAREAKGTAAPQSPEKPQTPTSEPKPTSLGARIASTTGKVGVGLAGAVATDIALDKPAEYVAKTFGAEEPETVQQTKEYIKAPFSGFVAGIPFGLAGGLQGAGGAILATGAEHATRGASEWAAKKMGVKDKSDVETTGELLRAPLVGAAGGALFGPLGAAVGAAVNTGVAAGKGVAKKIWGDEETEEAQNKALESEITRARRLRDPDTQKRLGISKDEAERRIEAGAPKQGGEFLGIATAGNVTGETAEQRKAREEADKQAARYAIGTSEIKQGIENTTKPFEGARNQEAGQAAYDSPFVQDVLKKYRQETRSPMASLNEFFAPTLARNIARTVAPTITRQVAPTVVRGTSPIVPVASRSISSLERRIGGMIDDVVNLPHSSSLTAARTFPANTPAPTTALPTATPKPYAEPLPKSPVEIDIPTKYPIVPFRTRETGIMPKLDTKLKTSTPLPLEKPITDVGLETDINLGTKPKPITNTGITTKTQTQSQTKTKAQTKTKSKTPSKSPPSKTGTVSPIPFRPGSGEETSEVDSDPGFVDELPQPGLAPGERLGAMKRDPVMSFTGSWITVPTPVYESKLSEKESLHRKVSKQKYKVIYTQDGKKVEVFAGSIRGVRRVVYGKKQFRVYNASGSDLTGYFRKLLTEK